MDARRQPDAANPRPDDGRVGDLALTMRRAIRAVARAEAIVVRSRESLARHRAEVARWRARWSPDAPPPPDEPHEDDPALIELRTAVEGYVVQLRMAGHPPERALVELKAVLRETPTAELRAADRTWLYQDIVHWAIDAYYKVGQHEGPDGAPADADALVDDCLAVLHYAGVRAFLARLNGRTRFRFTGAYRVEPPMLVNVALFDRENPRIDVGGAIVLLSDTCCSLVAQTRAPVGVEETHCDERLGLAARNGDVQSYQGVPITLANGRVWGTLCHFDHRPRAMMPRELRLLERVACALARRVLDAPPPQDDA